MNINPEVEPSAYTYKAMVYGYTKSEQQIKALKLFQQFVAKDLVVDPETLSMAITACRDVGEWKMALDM